MADDRLADEERRRNRQTRDAWEPFAAHRDRVARLLLDARRAASGATAEDGRATPAASLGLFGAGNLNDVDLQRLSAGFGRLHLIDLDGEALAAGLAAQQARLRPAAVDASNIALHVFDATGALPNLEAFRAAPQRQGAWEAALRAVDEGPVEAPGAPYDVVGSVGLLSQLLDLARRASAGRADAWELQRLVRRRHLRLAVDSTAPGGTAIVVFEVVSSDTLPALRDVADADLPELVLNAVVAGNFFTGLNPLALAQAVVDDPALSGRVARCKLAPPWRWNFGPRIYAATALCIERRGRGPDSTTENSIE